MRTGVLLIGVIILAASQTGAQEPATIQGSWRILCALSNSKEKLEEPGFQNSTISIGANRLAWLGADGKETVFAGDITLRPSKEKGTLNEVDLVIGKPGTKTLLGIYDLYLPDVLKISFSEGNVRPKGYGGGRLTQFLLLERIKPEAPKVPKTKGKDAELLLGTWTMLASLDDASDKIKTGPYSGHICVITKDRIEWRTNPKTATVAANYTIDPAKSPRHMDFLNTKGGNPPPPPDGFLPAIYEFLDDDTLKICYPESGFKKGMAPKDRPRPTTFFSDGDRNLWIMKRKIDK